MRLMPNQCQSNLSSPIYPVEHSAICSKSHQSILAIFDDLHRLEKHMVKVSASQEVAEETPGPGLWRVQRQDLIDVDLLLRPSHRLETSSTRAANSDIP